MKNIKTAFLLIMAAFLSKFSVMAQERTSANSTTQGVHYRHVKANGLNVFFREAGSTNAPTILLLHGYPTSSHMFRNLIPQLSAKYHVIAPDLPGFGYTDAPDRSQFTYSFDNLAKTMQSFIDELALKKFAIYVFDYGAPTGFRLAMANTEKVTAIISQNGNAYVEGLSHGWDPIRKYWENDTQENRDALRSFLTLEGTKFQYLTGVRDTTLVAPESYILDQHFLDRPQSADIQLDLLRDYRSNVALYPKFQEYFKTHQPPFLAVWGDKDPFFLPQGAEAYKRDIKKGIVKFYDTGHFALETHANEIGKEIIKFLDSLQLK